MGKRKHRRDVIPCCSGWDDKYVRLTEKGPDRTKEDSIERELGSVAVLLAFPQACVVGVGGVLRQGVKGFGLDIAVPLSPGWIVPRTGGPAGRGVVLLDYPVVVVYSGDGDLVGIILDASGAIWDCRSRPVDRYGGTALSVTWGGDRWVAKHPRVVIWWYPETHETVLFRRGKTVDAFC